MNGPFKVIIASLSAFSFPADSWNVFKIKWLNGGCCGGGYWLGGGYRKRVQQSGRVESSRYFSSSLCYSALSLSYRRLLKGSYPLNERFMNQKVSYFIRAGSFCGAIRSIAFPNSPFSCRMNSGNPCSILIPFFFFCLTWELSSQR